MKILCTFCISVTLLIGFCVANYFRPTNYEFNRTEIKKSSDFLRVCYYSLGPPQPLKINGTLCTHIIRGFATVKNDTFYPGNATNVEDFISTLQLRNTYPHLKIMVSFGGGGENNTAISVAMSTEEKRLKLINSVLNFLITYNFDGVDIDWEFPVWNDETKEDKQNFILFLCEFRRLSNKHNQAFILSVAVAGPKTIIDPAYDIPQMAKYVDFINLMSYDYHDYTLYTPFTGHNSPLFNRSVEKGYFSTLNTAWSSFYWNIQGMPLQKIMVGLPTYGHTYKLLNASLHDVDSPATGIGVGDGTSTYPFICDFLKSGGERDFDTESKVPYAYKDYDWISYDDIESLTEKAKFVKSNGFGGIMTFDLNCDDWQGKCNGQTTFPLHQAIYNVLGKD